MYKKYFLMLSLSFISMYAVMYANVFQLSHIHINVNRFYMTVLMIAPMAVIMLTLMHKMYENKRLNIIILTSAAAAFILSFIMLRNQTLIGDEQFMHSMIPHHSSAILVSENADIRDPEVKKLAEEIIKAQKEEIAEMNALLEKLNK